MKSMTKMVALYMECTSVLAASEWKRRRVAHSTTLTAKSTDSGANEWASCAPCSRAKPMLVMMVAKTIAGQLQWGSGGPCSE